MGSDQLSQNAINTFTEPENEVYLSAVSAWEISVKYKIEKLPLPLPPEKFIPRERERHFISFLSLSEQDTLHLHVTNSA